MLYFIVLTFEDISIEDSGGCITSKLKEIVNVHVFIDM